LGAPLLALAEREAAAAVRQAKGLVREAQAKVAAARAKVQAARSVVRQRESELDSAKATLTFRDRQSKRLKELHASGSVEQRIVDEKEGMVQAARAEVAGATAALANARAEVEVKEGEVAQAQAALATTAANVEAAEVALEKAGHSLGLTKLVAPFDGVVTRRNYRDGHYLPPPGEGGGRLPL